MSQTILIVAAGTGGHLYPGVALARAVQKHKPGSRILFAVRRGDMGRELLAREHFEIREFSGQGFPRGFSSKLITFPFKVAAGFWQARRALKELRPDVIVGMGGYLSFPLLLTARRLGIRTLVHEQNVLPGLANRLLGRWVNAVAVSFPESRAFFRNPAVWVSGLPVRPEIGTVSAEDGRARFGLRPGALTFLIFGGSLGASRLNETAVQAWRQIPDCRDWQVLHVTGPRDAEVTQAAYRTLPIKAAVMSYCHDMAAAYAAADVVVARAGASTIAELSVVRKPAILVPYPFAAENHQLMNAEVLVRRGTARVILDADLTADSFAQALRQFASRDRPPAAPDDHSGAADRLAEYVLR